MWVNFEFCIYCHPVNSNLQHDPTHKFTKDNFFCKLSIASSYFKHYKMKTL